jgi:hypothetical protein
MGFRQAAAGWGLPQPKSNRGYAPVQLIEQFIVSIWCGACRFVQAETVRMDGTMTRLFGWSRAAGHKAIMRLFGHFDMLTNERVQAEAYRWFFGKLNALQRITLDVDSTVITRNGEQLGAARVITRAGMDGRVIIRSWPLSPRPAWPRRFLAQRSQPEPPDALRASPKTCLIPRPLGQCLRSTCHPRAGSAWLMDNLG